MPRNLKLFLVIVISLIAIVACGLLFLFLYNRPNNNGSSNNIKGSCCTCLDCPQCDVCCDCGNPYLNK